MLVFALGVLFLPLAGFSAGLVPCGEAGNPCNICHLFELINRVWGWIINFIVTPIAVLMLMIGGFMLVTAAGNPSQVETGKKILTAAVIGVAIIFGAFIMVNTVFKAIGVSDFAISFTGADKWAQFNCTIR